MKLYQLTRVSLSDARRPWRLGMTKIIMKCLFRWKVPYQSPLAWLIRTLTTRAIWSQEGSKHTRWLIVSINQLNQSPRLQNSPWLGRKSLGTSILRNTSLHLKRRRSSSSQRCTIWGRPRPKRQRASKVFLTLVAIAWTMRTILGSRETTGPTKWLLATILRIDMRSLGK